jgi:hypothetical protein
MLLKAAVQSLASSTAAVMRGGGVEATITGRCSPYKTHRIVAYRQYAHPYMLAAANSKYALVIWPDEPADTEEDRRTIALALPNTLGGCDGYATEPHTMPVPSTMLAPLAAEAQRWLGIGLPSSGIVWVTVRARIFTGYDDAGKPTWQLIAPAPEEPAVPTFTLLDEGQG